MAQVRFVNALSGADGNLLLTANGTIVGAQQAFARFTRRPQRVQDPAEWRVDLVSNAGGDASQCRHLFGDLRIFGKGIL